MIFYSVSNTRSVEGDLAVRAGRPPFLGVGGKPCLLLLCDDRKLRQRCKERVSTTQTTTKNSEMTKTTKPCLLLLCDDRKLGQRCKEYQQRKPKQQQQNYELENCNEAVEH